LKAIALSRRKWNGEPEEACTVRVTLEYGVDEAGWNGGDVNAKGMGRGGYEAA